MEHWTQRKGRTDMDAPHTFNGWEREYTYYHIGFTPKYV